SDLMRSLVVGRKNASWNAIKPCELRCAKAALPCDDFIAISVLHNENGLKNTVLFDRVRERLDFFVVEMRTNLKLGSIDFVDWNKVHEKGREILQVRVGAPGCRASRRIKLFQVATSLAS